MQKTCFPITSRTLYQNPLNNSLLSPLKEHRDNPTALHLRAMNMLFEGLKEKGALVIVPSSAVDTMNLGGLSGTIALAQQVQNASDN